MANPVTNTFEGVAHCESLNSAGIAWISFHEFLNGIGVRISPRNRLPVHPRINTCVCCTKFRFRANIKKQNQRKKKNPMSTPSCPSLKCVPVIAGSVAVGVVLGVLYSRKQQSKAITKGEVKNEELYTPNGPVAQRIAAVTPYFPFKGIERFYDIGGFLKNPGCPFLFLLWRGGGSCFCTESSVSEVFHLVIDAFVSRYRNMDIDSIGTHASSTEVHIEFNFNE